MKVSKNKTTKVKFIANALILHKTYIKTGRYRFKDPSNRSQFVIVEVAKSGGITLNIGDASKSLASEENLLLSTTYQLTCYVNISTEINLFPTKQNKEDWPRSSEGRNFMEGVFLEKINYFFDNLVYLSSKKNPNHHLLSSVRPIGSQDIISIDFYLKNRIVAAQGNPVLTQIAMNWKDDRIWPKTSHLTYSFTSLPVEQNLLNRSCALVRIGFYQEALIVAFSVLDAKVQELIKDRMENEFSFNKKEAKNYLMNISQNRLDTLLNFLFKIFDKTSLKSRESTLSKQVSIINNKRNRIVHEGESATKEEAIEAIITISKVLDHLNKHHKGQFDIPTHLIDDSKNWQIF